VKRPRDQDDLSIPRITTDAATAERIWLKLQALCPGIDASKQLVIVNPNASELFLLRKLPLENYARLVQRLLEDPEVYVAITGVRREKPDAQYICAAVQSERVIDLTGETTLTELLHVFNLARMVITNDSGPAHFACLTGAHIIVFFGPELPDRFRPLSERCDVIYARYTCSPCVSPYNQRLTPCNDNLCLKTLSVDRIYEVARRRLDEARNTGPALRTGALDSPALAP
jgi:ADP-heptose:LPS heptosyltransferase